MERIFIFIVLSIPVIAISRRTLFHPRSHGFYRFFAWEGILWLAASNYRYWFSDPLSVNKIVAWILLALSAYTVIAGVMRFAKDGKIDRSRDAETLFGFEKTTKLIDRGIYKYIRHPLYASLIFLAWGIFFKHPTTGLLLVTILSTLMLYLTSRVDEKECLAYFGNPYMEYMKRTTMFIPFIL
jgi:protein-S-isoprenylcysteine O-methyltransferase Ste14